MADQAIRVVDKEFWLRLAADWIKLAEAAEKQNRSGPLQE
jgi:hypothetical protein